MSTRLEFLQMLRVYLEAGKQSSQHDQEMLNIYDLELREINREIEKLSSPERSGAGPSNAGEWIVAIGFIVMGLIIALWVLRC